MDNIGKKIKKVRELRNYSRQYIAKKLRLSLNSYGKIERDEVDITLGRFAEIARILDVSMCMILEFDENKIFKNN